MISFFQKFNLGETKVVGFDMDGTLYDEYMFIDQVYSSLVQECECFFQASRSAEVWMKRRWLEMGSSYPRIFGEAHDLFGNNASERELFVTRALDIYRNFSPNLQLTGEVEVALDFFKKNFDIFLVSDGNSTVQSNKFSSLGLQRWFRCDRVFFTGDLGPECYKPSVSVVNHLQLCCLPSECLYFGDRDIDAEFCRKAGFKFQRVFNMEPVL